MVQILRACAAVLLVLPALCSDGRAQASGAAPAPATSAGAALSIDGEVVPLDLYARWLVSNFGERSVQTFARDFWAVERAAREAGVDVSPEECARRVDTDLQERIQKAFFGRRSEWLAELARTGRTEAGVRLQRETEERPYALAEAMAAVDRVVPEEKVVRDWQMRYGRNGRRYDLHMTKTQVVVPSKEHQPRAEWEAERQKVLDAGLEKARAVRARLLAGEDFGQVARETSDDPDTRDGRGVPRRGFTHQGWPSSFLDALEKLAPGEVSEPLFARGGWWVVRVDAVHVTPLADVHDELQAALERKGPEADEVAAVLARIRDATTFRMLPALFDQGDDPELDGPNAPVLEVDGEPVARATFARWLVALHGEPSLQRFVEDWAIQRAAARRGVAVTPDEVEARVRTLLQQRIEEGYGSSREAWQTFLDLNGRTETSFVHSLRERTRTDLLLEKLMLLERVVTPEEVRSRYGSEYGAGGQRTEVRWIVAVNQLEGVDPNWTREQLTAALQAASERARARVAALVSRARAGEDFAALARAESDDAATREQGGKLEGRFRADVYPASFGAAVARLAPGEVSDPLDYGNAWVAFQVVSRRKVTFDEVRDELEAELRTQRPNGLDVNARRNELTQKLKVEILPGLAAR